MPLNIADPQIHSLPAGKLLSALGANPSGLTKAEADARLQAYGENKLTEGKKKTLFAKFFSAICDKMTLVLLLAAAASYIASKIAGHADYDFIIILFIIVLNGIIGTVQEQRASRALEALEALQQPTCYVMRDNAEIEINSKYLVPGDIILLKKGGFVPADAILLEANSLVTDESSLTGESAGVHKSIKPSSVEAHITDRKNVVFSSSAIIGGNGVAVVTATGMNTYVGKIADLITGDKNEKTPLQLRLAKISTVIGNAALIICLIILGISLLYSMPFAEMFLTSVSLAVAAIPEGLPAIVAIILSIGVQQMAKKNAIIKHLTGVETLGCATVICSDKTGTITENRMTVVETDRESDILLRCCLLCNDRASPTENALYNYAASNQSLTVGYKRQAEIPFDSAVKYMVTVDRFSGGYLTVMKGAPDVLAAFCPEIRTKSALIGDMCSRALRLIAFIYCESASYPANPLHCDFRYCGIVGIIDPPRSEVKKSIADCKLAGIRVIMITGDHPDTAGAIARQVGIIGDGGIVTTEKQFAVMPAAEQRLMISKCNVFARTSPEFKLTIVKMLKESGHVTAMTGDGVNDAPALMESDIGCAMGIAGTDVAKSSCDIILTDDNFSTIVGAVKQGRGIFANIKRAVHFLLSCNMGEIFTVFVAIILNFPSPLAAVQLLWVNLVTDSLPAIALGVEKIDDDVMKMKPINKKTGLFSGGNVAKMIMQGIMIGSLSLAAYFIGVSHCDHYTGRTMAFCVLSLSQLFHALTLRSGKSFFKIGFFSNKAMALSFFMCIILQLSVVVFVPLQSIFKTVQLDMFDWLIIAGLSVCPLIISEFLKMFGKKQY